MKKLTDFKGFKIEKIDTIRGGWTWTDAERGDGRDAYTTDKDGTKTLWCANGDGTWSPCVFA